MRLSALGLGIPQNVVAELENVGVLTDTDLLFRESSLDLFQKLPNGTLSLRDLKALTARVIEVCAAPGAASFDMSPISNTPLSSGLKFLDKLTGCFAGSPVVEVAGDNGSGRSILCLNLVFRLLATDTNSTVLWIDTRGDFSPEKAIHVLDEMDIQSTDVLDRLRVSTCLELDAVYGVLWSLQMSPENTRCIIIDNVASILGPQLSWSSAQGHAIMTGFMRHLRELALNLKLTVIVINNATSLRDAISTSALPWTTKKPTLGPSFAFQSDTSLWLSKREEESEIVYYAEVLHSRSVASNSYCRFGIVNGVLNDLSLGGPLEENAQSTT